MDPIALVKEIADAVPAVLGAIDAIVAHLRAHHPELDLSPLGAGIKDADDARAEALRRV